MPQLSVSLAPPIGYGGQLADASPKHAISRRAEGASVVAGLPCVFGTTPAKEVRPVASTDALTARNFAGFVLLSTSRQYSSSAIEDGDEVSVLREGVVYLTFSEAVTCGERVALTVSGQTLQGIAEGSAVGAGQKLLPGCRIIQTTSAAGVAAVEVDLDGLAEPLAGLSKLPNIPIGSVARASIGTDGAGVAGTIYAAEIVIPSPRVVTGIGVLNGTTVGTDNVIVALYDEGGMLLANSALAGTLGAGADDFQEIAFTASIEIPAGRYFVATQFNGTTHATQRIAASTYLNRMSATAGSFGTLPALTPPTGQTANAGPIAYVY